MADMQQYTVALTGQGGVQTPRASIAARVTDSTTGQTLFDFTGANALNFPAVLRDLTDAQFEALIRDIIGPWIVMQKAGMIQ